MKKKYWKMFWKEKINLNQCSEVNDKEDKFCTRKFKFNEEYRREKFKFVDKIWKEKLCIGQFNAFSRQEEKTVERKFIYSRDLNIENIEVVQLLIDHMAALREPPNLFFYMCTGSKSDVEKGIIMFRYHMGKIRSNEVYQKRHLEAGRTFND
jgi:hypothetical protein